MYLSTRLDAVKKTLTALCKTATAEERAYYEALYDIVSATAQQVDVIGSRLDEIEEKTENFETYTEHLSASLQSLRDCIVGDVRIDTDAYTADYDGSHGGEECDCGCDDGEHSCGHSCGDCDHGHCDEDDAYEDFITVQCPFCQELFFVERAEYEDNVECPLCGHSVAVLDNAVGSDGEDL